MSETTKFNNSIHSGYLLIANAVEDAKSQFPNQKKDNIKLISYKLAVMRNSCTLIFSLDGYEKNYTMWLNEQEFEDVELYINFSRTNALFSNILV